MNHTNALRRGGAQVAKRHSWLPRMLVIALIAAGLVAVYLFLPFKQYLLSMLEWVQNIGIWGPVVLVLFYIAACVFMIPGSLVTLGAGFLYKLLWGTVIVSLASTIGAGVAFLVGRTIARNWVARKVANNLKFNAIDRAVGREGFKIVFLTRLSPAFPFVLLNYAYGLTNVRFRDYILASWIGMLPGTVMYVYFGSGLRSIADVATKGQEGNLAKTIAFWIGMAVAIGVTVFVTRMARRALKEAVRSLGATPPLFPRCTNICLDSSGSINSSGARDDLTRALHDGRYLAGR